MQFCNQSNCALRKHAALLRFMSAWSSSSSFGSYPKGRGCKSLCRNQNTRPPVSLRGTAGRAASPGANPAIKGKPPATCELQIRAPISEEPLYPQRTIPICPNGSTRRASGMTLCVNMGAGFIAGQNRHQGGFMPSATAAQASATVSGIGLRPKA